MLVPVRQRQLFLKQTQRPEARNECTLFFVHGAMASLENFRFQLDYFAPLVYQTIAYDYYGCGKSPKLDDSKESYTTEQHLADLVAVFTKYKTKQNILIGHSFGTNQILRLAMETAGMDVSGLVLIAPALFPDGGHWIFKLPEFILYRIQPMLSKNFTALAFHEDTKRALTPEHVELMQHTVARSNSNSMHVCKSFYTQIKFVKREEVVERVPAKLPVLLLCGSADPLTPMEMTTKMKQWLDARPGATQAHVQVIAPAAHQLMEEQPEQTNEALLAFFKTCGITF